MPATIDLAGAEIELVSMVARENRLRNALAALDDSDFDYVFIDCRRRSACSRSTHSWRHPKC